MVDLDFFLVLICESFDIIIRTVSSHHSHWIPNSYPYNIVNTSGLFCLPAQIFKGDLMASSTRY
ncbi:hypothetical protein Hanom_Chr15g01407461 [Helianthus anomalus]